MKKILLLGASGYMGKAFKSEIISRGYKIFTPKLAQINYCDFNILQKYIDKIEGIDFLINAAGFTGKPNVEQCEIQRDQTIKGNLLLPQMLSHLSALYDFLWLQIGTGCIYEGDNNGVGYTEEDEPNFCFKFNNCSFYSGIKALTEEYLKKDPRCYVARLRIPFNEIDNPRNYISKLMFYQKTYDNVNSLSHIGDYTRICMELYEKKCETGIYNITNVGGISTRLVISMIKKILKPTRQFEYYKNDIEFYKIAKTPRSNCVLNVNKLHKVNISIRSVEDAIHDTLKNWKYK